MVNGPGPEIGKALINEVDYICFTGSTATGRIVGSGYGGSVAALCKTENNLPIG